MIGQSPSMTFPPQRRKTTFIKSKSNYEMILDKGLNYGGSCTSLHHPYPTLIFISIKYVLMNIIDKYRILNVMQ